jgi:hypothetical protein
VLPDSLFAPPAASDLLTSCPLPEDMFSAYTRYVLLTLPVKVLLEDILGCVSLGRVCCGDFDVLGIEVWHVRP